MTARTRVGVLFGGMGSEHDVSIASGAGVAAGLDPDRFEVVPIGVDREGGWHRPVAVTPLDGRQPGSRWPRLDGVDVVFPALHGRYGEDGTVQGLLELVGIPYVGCGILASATAMDKAHTGRVLAAVGLSVPHSRVVTSSTIGMLETEELPYPLFVKPNRSGSSVGVTRVVSPDRLGAAIDTALAEDGVALVQDALDGIEVDLAVLQHPDGCLAVGAPLRVRTTHAFFDHAAKYTPGGVEFDVPATLPGGLRERLEAAALAAFTALGCDGLARVDFFVNGDAFVVNEVNTMPGMTALSQFPRMWEASGIPYRDVLTVLVERARTVVR